MANVNTSKKSQQGSSVKKSQNTLFDQECLDAIENPNMMIPWYLMASYAYYEEDDSILSDGLFDGLAHCMLEVWDLKAGTLLRRDFPGRVKGAVEALRKK